MPDRLNPGAQASSGPAATATRSHGPRFEPLRMKPHDHIGWTFAGPDEFAALAEPFLAEGAARNERLMYVADAPDVAAFGAWADALYPGTLTASSTAEVYGGSGFVDASEQRAVFAEVLADALAAGYSGIRVAADNTSMVLDPERLESWLRWEVVADHFMSENQVTGLCAFDRARVDVDTLRNVATMHPVSQAESPPAPFRLFTRGGALVLQGRLDAAAVGQAGSALHQLPAGTGLVVDLASAEVADDGALSALRHLRQAGVPVTVRGPTDMVRQLRAAIT